MIQQPMFPPPSNWRPPRMGELPSWREARRVAVDIETHDPSLKKMGSGVRRGSYICGVSFAIEDGPAHYLPIRHGGDSDNLPEAAVWAYLKDQADVFTGSIVGQNLSYDLDYLADNGVWFGKAQRFRDVMVTQPLIDENMFSFSLENIAKYWGIPGKDEHELRVAAAAWGVSPKGGMAVLPARYVAPYAIQDVLLPLAISRLQERRLEDEELWGVYELESKLTPVLVKMTRRGVRVDLDRLDRLEKWAAEKELEQLEEVKISTGVALTPDDVWVAEAVAAPLRAVGIELHLTATEQPRTSADYLESLNHPAARALVKARKFNKLRTTFISSIGRFQVNGRIHASIKQLRGESTKGKDIEGTGARLSYSNPNLQQVPNPEKNPEISSELRKIFVPESGQVWACVDYSGQELRLAVHYAAACGLSGADAAVKAYEKDPRTDLYKMVAAMFVTGKGGNESEIMPLRKKFKVAVLSRMYGASDAKLCYQLGFATQTVQRDWGLQEVAGPEGTKFLADFDAQIPWVRALQQMCRERASARGFVKTFSGRKRRFTKDSRGRYDYVHKALNDVIQGTAADQCKKALIDLDVAGFLPRLQVHDEIDSSVNGADEALAMADIMRDVYQLKTPMLCDVEIGPSWGEVVKCAKPQ